MLNSLYLKNKVQRQINMNGQEFEFNRYEEDEYHQISDVPTTTIKVTGIYHTSNSFVTNNASDAAVVRTKQQPMILLLFDDANKLKQNDKVTINNENFKVVDINNVNEFNVACEISLEIER